MSDPIKCPVCSSSSIVVSSKRYLLVDADELEIDVTDYDNDNITFDLALSGEVAHSKCLDCNRSFYL